jgi:hypothetical protein
MTAVIDTYVALLPSEHADKPLFTSALKALVQGFVDELNAEIAIATGFDIDTAVGAQLDQIALWVGVNRFLSLPITGVYFSFDTAGVGWDQGIWKLATDPSTGISALPDDSFRILIKSKIVANHWDGTTPGLMSIINYVFASAVGTFIFVYDNQDMSMNVVITGVALSPVNYALLTQGHIVPTPAGVLVNYITGSGGSPLFGFDASSPYIAGFDTGTWAP